MNKQHWAGLALTAMLATSPAFAMGMPSVQIESPKPGQTVRTQDIPVTLDVEDFTLEGAHAGQPAEPGRGHIHVMVDGMDMKHLTNVTTATHFTIPGQGLKPGKHTVYVMLASDDHMPASKPSMVSFEYAPAKVAALPAAMAGSPSVRILSPADGATVPRKFVLHVATDGFKLSCAEGKANVPGYGHLHVMVHEAGVTDQPAHDMMMPMMGKGMMKPMPMVGMVGMPCTDEVPIDLSAWKPGKVMLSVMLANNDHSPVAAQPATITLNLQ